jgi:catechol 2,3-dioxygenase-like lactoylglutathione lyase family enzyme
VNDSIAEWFARVNTILMFNPYVLIFNQAMEIVVEHLAIAAANPAALKNWYERVLGANAVWDNGQNPPTCLIALGGVWLEIYQAAAPLAAHGNLRLAGFRHLALRVTSLAAARAELEKRGVKFPEAERPAAGGGKVLFFEDGEGNLLHLVERPMDSTLVKFNAAI